MTRGSSVLLCLALLAFFQPGWAAPGELTVQQQRGKRIYTEGLGQGALFARLSSARIQVPASQFACIRCHQENGAGGQEGGVRVADITPASLRASYSGPRPTGRTHPPYDEATLAQAIRAGLDPAGQVLHPGMPRYDIQDQDLADLLAYLKVLGQETTPGVSARAVRIGMLLPDRGPLQPAGELIRNLLTALFADLNAQGGLFGRRLALVPVAFDPSRPRAALQALEDISRRAPVFAWIANLGLSPDDPARGWLAAQAVPVLAPLEIPLEADRLPAPNVFHIYAGIQTQAHMLVDYLVRDLARTRAALLYSEDDHGRAGAASVRAQAQKAGINLLAEAAYPNGQDTAALVRQFKAKAPEAVFLFGPGAAARDFLREAARQDWHPLLLGSAELFGTALLSLPEEESRQVYLVSPLRNPDPQSAQMANFLRIVDKARIPGEYKALQLTAYAGTLLLQEGLTQSGRALSRRKFLDHLGQLWQFQTGVTPPLSYNENRRVGALGAEILRMDSRKRGFVVVSDWREARRAR